MTEELHSELDKLLIHVNVIGSWEEFCKSREEIDRMLKAYDQMNKILRKECGDYKCSWDCIECIIHHKERRYIMREFKLTSEFIKRCFEELEDHINGIIERLDGIDERLDEMNQDD